MNKFVQEDLEDAIRKLKKMGKKVDADSVTRKDLVDLTRAKGNWELTPDELEKVTNQTPNIHRDTTKPGRIGSATAVDDAPMDLQNDTDFTTGAGFDNNTRVDDFSSTAVISRVADELAAKLSSSEYRAMSSADLKAALEIELKNYLTK